MAKLRAAGHEVDAAKLALLGQSGAVVADLERLRAALRARAGRWREIVTAFEDAIAPGMLADDYRLPGPTSADMIETDQRVARLLSFHLRRALVDGLQAIGVALEAKLREAEERCQRAEVLDGLLARELRRYREHLTFTELAALAIDLRWSGYCQAPGQEREDAVERVSAALRQRLRAARAGGAGAEVVRSAPRRPRLR